LERLWCLCVGLLDPEDDGTVILQNIRKYSKSSIIQCWMIQEALLTGNLEKPIIFHYSIYWQQPAPILKAQKAKFDQERLYIG